MTQHTTGNRQEATESIFNIGDKVEILGNAQGTTWKLGYIADIDGNKEALINYGDKDFPIYGMGIRKAFSQLRKV